MSDKSTSGLRERMKVFATLVGPSPASRRLFVVPTARQSARKKPTAGSQVVGVGDFLGINNQLCRRTAEVRCLTYNQFTQQSERVDRKLPPPDFRDRLRDRLAYASSLWCVLLHVYPCHGVELTLGPHLVGISLVYWLIVSNVGKLAGAAGSVFHVAGWLRHSVCCTIPIELWLWYTCTRLAATDSVAQVSSVAIHHYHAKERQLVNDNSSQGYMSVGVRIIAPN
jgi:hypothetical protein